MNFANIGVAVTMVERKQEALDRGLKVIRGNYERSLKRGKLTAAEVDARMALLSGSLELDAVADCDLVIEAVFESMALKKQIFGSLDTICKAGAILATNTSGLNVDEIAAVTKRPEAGDRPALLQPGQRDEADRGGARRQEFTIGNRDVDGARQENRQDRGARRRVSRLCR